jgi:TetR/AcrR family transcriptional regulator, transcriptional repressor for nem operon
MRYPAEETAERHRRIIAEAARMMRENGFDGCGVAEVMKAAGLTHGAFYAHFESKEALAAAALEHALEQTVGLADRAADEAAPLAAFADPYLSRQHRDQPGKGCAMTSLAADVSRKGPSIRTVFARQFGRLVAALMGPTRDHRETSRSDVIGTLSTLVGAMALARAVDDPELADEILDQARRYLGLQPL